MSYKILILDIETSPNVAHVWRFFKTNVGANQVIEHSTILSYAAKWLEEDEIVFEWTKDQTEKSLLKKLNKVLHQADMVVAHNGAQFDCPKIRGRSLVHNIKPAKPYKEIDTVKVARKEFGFESNSLEYLAKVLGCTPKTKHKNFPGHELWIECLKNNPAAWAEMKEYNINDVTTLEEVYLKMRPYIRYHPNVAVYMENDEITCPKCGSTANVKEGFAYTHTGKYQQYSCKSCGGWHRGRFTEYPAEKRAVLTTNSA